MLLRGAPLLSASRRSQGDVAARAQAGSGQGDGAVPEQWWDDLRRGSISGPPGGVSGEAGPSGKAAAWSAESPGMRERDYSSLAEGLLGVKGYRELEGIDKGERQRAWDAMRASAWGRYQAGTMPSWFNPDWLMQQEAPLNRMLRLDGNEVYQTDDTWVGGGGGDSGGAGKGGGDSGGGNGWWREDDPYWQMRDWGDHPMRWWTFAFAGVLALGGVLSYARFGSADSLWFGAGAGAALSAAAMAMSDMGDWGHGPLAVKAAFGVCAALAAKEIWFGWAHRPAPGALSEVMWGTGGRSTSSSQRGGRLQSSQERWGGCARACALMCVAYMWTGMNGLDELALPTNPGAVYKNPDVSIKHRVWEKWGFGNAAMRTGASASGRVSGVAQQPRRAVSVRAVPPDAKQASGLAGAGKEWITGLLSRFGPVRERGPNVTTLDFEKPLVELDKRISEVRKVAEDNGVDVSAQMVELENRATELRRETYSRLTPTQRLQVARHPNRPSCLDVILNITDKFVELHGDRAGVDDPAIVCGIGSMDGIPFMFVGQQKGRNTKENIRRNFGMPQPNGYRKAMRFMRHANKFGLPIITIVDTPGAYAGKAAEELGQGEAIAFNLREMFGLRVPILSLVIGEGGSGGALAIGVSNKNLIMENAVYYVASPEACAAILWKSRAATKAATEALRITAPELIKFGVMDEIVPEPLGGSHADPAAVFPTIKAVLLRNFEAYRNLSAEEIQLDRYAKFRKLGLFEEFVVKGADLKSAQVARAGSEGVRTEAGAWAADAGEAAYIEGLVDADEKWDKLMEGRQEWVNRPVQPPGLGRSGVMELAVSMVEMRRRKQAAAAH
ncbi:hypothetical protein FOA52_002283 [Chlamydomonas sp. UWO 241]|nr:hypothetical protein FOA52_002283 [Chlamydomonas sp. UWO 241]